MLGYTCCVAFQGPYTSGQVFEQRVRRWCDRGPFGSQLYFLLRGPNTTRPIKTRFLPKSGGIERNPVATSSTPRPFLARHEFLIRRLHSLSGLIPVGAFMTVHLFANASVLESPGTFQRTVYQIHSLGRMLPLVEWAFIFLPILFHGIFGFIIVMSGQMNSGTYRYVNNFRYTMQRITGILAFVFILWHVFHMHGWFHAEAWLTNVADPLGGHQFRAFNAPSTLGAAMAVSVVIPIIYAIGLLSCVFHLANGIWTMGITWGVWTSPAAQRRANWVCGLAGLFLAAVGMSALYGAVTVDRVQAVEVENKMYEAKVEAGEISANEHKRAAQETDAAPH